MDFLHQTLAARVEELERLFDCIQMGMGLIGRDLRFIRVNERLAEINGLSAEAHRGRLLSEVLPEMSAEIEPLVRRALEGEATMDLETIAVSPGAPDTRQAWMVSYFPVRDVGGEIFAVSTVLQEVTTSYKLREEVLEATNRERDRLGREIHDSICQELGGISLLAKTVEENLAAEAHPKADRLADLVHLLDSLTTKARNVAHSLSPLSLEDRSLGRALANLAETISTLYQGVECEVVLESRPHDLPVALASEVYFIASEAVFNAARHSGAHRIQIELSEGNDSLVLRILDDGAGIGGDPNEAAGFGLRSMKARAWNLGGTVIVRDQSGDQRGVVVECEIPRPVDD